MTLKPNGNYLVKFYGMHQPEVATVMHIVQHGDDLSIVITYILPTDSDFPATCTLKEFTDAIGSALAYKPPVFLDRLEVEIPEQPDPAPSKWWWFGGKK